MRKFIKELNGHSKNFDQSIYKVFIKEVVFPSMPYFMKKFIKLILKKNVDFILNENFLKESGIERIDLSDMLDYIGKMTTKEYHYFSINSPLDQTVFGIIDRSTANYNIEKRYPFFDKRLVEFCYSLPTGMKLRHGWDRYILRIAMEDILPSEIQWRSQKTNQNYFYKRNLMLFEKKTLEKIIYDDNELIKKYVDIKTIQKIYEKYESGKGENLFEIWLVVLIYFWIKSRS